MPAPAALALISWSGMRGGVSLAAALAIPLTTDAGEPFPGRDLILFLTFAVIFGTLVIQGLTLPAVIRLLRLEDDGEDDARELAQARIQAARPPARLEELADEDWVRRRHRRAGPRQLRLPAEPLRRLARRRRRRLDRGALARLPAAAARAARPPSARRCTSCGGEARSPTRWRAASSATSTSRTPGSRSRSRALGAQWPHRRCMPTRSKPTSPSCVGSLAGQFPHWAELPIEPVVVVRHRSRHLPSRRRPRRAPAPDRVGNRTGGEGGGVAAETRPALAARGSGAARDGSTRLRATRSTWSVYEWLPGENANGPIADLDQAARRSRRIREGAAAGRRDRCPSASTSAVAAPHS